MFINSLHVHNNGSPVFAELRGVNKMVTKSSKKRQRHLHSGRLISEKLDELRLSQAWLAEQINTSRQNIHRMLDRPSIDIHTMARVSEALGYDFFAHYRPEKPNNEANEPVPAYHKPKEEVVVLRVIDGKVSNVRQVDMDELREREDRLEALEKKLMDMMERVAKTGEKLKDVT
jgi:hypothetical protein